MLNDTQSTPHDQFIFHNLLHGIDGHMIYARVSFLRDNRGIVEGEGHERSHSRYAFLADFKNKNQQSDPMDRPLFYH